MRRKDREITDSKTMEAVIAESKFCRMALCDNGKPYVVPLCFGYRDRTVYFHCAGEGRKLAVLRRNSEVCLEFESGACVVENTVACRWRLRYKSVIAYGKAKPVDNGDEIRAALDLIMNHYGKGPFTFSDEDLKRVLIYKVPIGSMTCKISA
ncbi:MAG TPA: pyridoxamine 5'-phosphate oxidase family protein [Chitinivibrionales bacterium]|nr:pyridoxamine 5'-phosphate oxidase family protein [Chitinivibrionales bacterium]